MGQRALDLQLEYNIAFLYDILESVNLPNHKTIELESDSKDNVWE